MKQNRKIKKKVFRFRKVNDICPWENKILFDISVSLIRMDVAITIKCWRTKMEFLELEMNS